MIKNDPVTGIPQLGRFFVVLALALAIPATTLWIFSVANVDTANVGNRWRQITWIFIYTLCCLGFMTDLTRLRVFLSVNPWLIAFLLFAGLTVTWSAEPFVGLKRWIELIGLLWVAGAVVSFAKPSMDSVDVINWIKWPFAALIIASFIAVFAWPDIGLSHLPRSPGWQGLAPSKNAFGQICMMGGMVWLLALNKGFFRRLLQIGIIALTLVCLWFSQSATSLVSFLLGTTIMAVLALLQAMRRHGWQPLLLGGLLIASIAAYGLLLIEDGTFWYTLVDRLASLLGKDMTLTGRTSLWHMIWSEIQFHPWLGAGYGTTWVKSSHVELLAYFKGMLFEAQMGHAHNGYLDLISDTGYIGFGLVIAALANHFMRLLRLYFVQKDPVSYLYIALFGAFIFTNMTESLLFEPEMQTLILLISIVHTEWLIARYPAPKSVTKQRAVPNTAPVPEVVGEY